MSEPEVIFSIEGRAGVITLNRPKALNALSFGMVKEMDRQLAEWASDPAVAIVMITGGAGAPETNIAATRSGAGAPETNIAAERSGAFCSGGDIKSVAEAVKKGGAARAEAGEFFRAEYTLNHRIFTYPKPYVALVDGIVMGGGKGVSAHGSHRVVTENTLFAMPEATIGFFPDVGGGYFLPRCPGQTGLYLALTGRRIKTFDTLYIGFATHFVPQEKLRALRAAIAMAPQRLEAILNKFAEEPPPLSDLAPYREKIDGCFAHDSIAEIFAALERDASDWALGTLATLRAVSPSSLKIALRQIRLGATMDFASVMAMEYRLSQACIDRPDFYEGVRAALIDKDRRPRWNPPTVARVKDADIEACFQSLGAQELVL